MSLSVYETGSDIRSVSIRRRRNMKTPISSSRVRDRSLEANHNHTTWREREEAATVGRMGTLTTHDCSWAAQMQNYELDPATGEVLNIDEPRSQARLNAGYQQQADRQGSSR